MLLYKILIKVFWKKTHIKHNTTSVRTGTTIKKRNSKTLIESVTFGNVIFVNKESSKGTRETKFSNTN